MITSSSTPLEKKAQVTGENNVDLQIPAMFFLGGKGVVLRKNFIKPKIIFYLRIYLTIRFR